MEESSTPTAPRRSGSLDCQEMDEVNLTGGFQPRQAYGDFISKFGMTTSVEFARMHTKSTNKGAQVTFVPFVGFISIGLEVRVRLLGVLHTSYKTLPVFSCLVDNGTSVHFQQRIKG